MIRKEQAELNDSDWTTFLDSTDQNKFKYIYTEKERRSMY